MCPLVDFQMRGQVLPVKNIQGIGDVSHMVFIAVQVPGQLWRPRKVLGSAPSLKNYYSVGFILKLFLIQEDPTPNEHTFWKPLQFCKITFII